MGYEITREFWCDTCQMEQSITLPELLAHLKDVHSITQFHQGKGNALSFVDGQGYFQQNWEWHFGPVTVREVKTGKRTK